MATEGRGGVHSIYDRYNPNVFTLGLTKQYVVLNTPPGNQVHQICTAALTPVQPHYTSTPD